jgi:succinoglycan biosynthesis transport protein ExoP
MSHFQDRDAADSAEARPAPARNPLQVAWQRKPLVALGVIVGVVVAALFASQRAPVYQSSAQVLVVKKHADSALQVPGGDPRTDFYEDYVSTHLALIRSQVVIERAVAKHDLGALPSFAGRGNPTGAIMGSLTATRDTKESGANNIINLSYKGGVSEDCPVVIDAVIKSYKDFLDELYHNVSDDTLDLINQARTQVEEKLATAQKRHADFLKDAPLLPAQGKEGGPAAPPGLVELESRRLALLMRKAEIEERLKALEQAKKDGTARDLVQSLTAAAADKSPPIPDVALETQLLPLLLEEQALSRDFGDDHPQVQSVRRKIEMTREFLAPEKRAARLAATRPAAQDDSVEVYARSLRQELATIKVSKQSLVELTEEEKKEARKVAVFEAEESRLRADIVAQQQLKDQIFNRLEDIRRARNFGGYDARMTSRPGPGGKVGTGLVQLLLAGLAVGLLLGVGLAYLADMTDKSFRSPEEIRGRLGLPVVAHVPIMQEEGAPSSPDAPQMDRSLAIVHRPRSAEAEAARSLRTSLFFSTKGTTHKVIQVTSPNMGDGKSTIAANLAIAIAQSGKRVVLVDADMRRPRVHSLFGVRPEVGLTSVIVGEAPLAAALVDSGIERLSLIACGPRPENPAELLTQPRFEEVLAELRGQFDFVIVDTPPLMAVTDPAVAVSRMDGVFLVIRLSRNGRPAAERAREILYTLQANVLGVVVNGVGRAAGSYGYEHYSYQDPYAASNYVSTAAETNGHAEATNGAARPKVAVRPSRKKRPGWFRRLIR